MKVFGDLRVSGFVSHRGLLVPGSESDNTWRIPVLDMTNPNDVMRLHTPVKATVGVTRSANYNSVRAEASVTVPPVGFTDEDIELTLEHAFTLAEQAAVKKAQELEGKYLA